MYRKSCKRFSQGVTNRDLVLEYCGEHKMAVANSFFEYPDENLVTYHSLTSHPLDTIQQSEFLQLDYCLCPQVHHDLVYDCWTDRTLALRTHHFAIIVVLNISFSTTNYKQNNYKDKRALKEEPIRKLFCGAFNDHIMTETSTMDIEEHAKSINVVFDHASQVLLTFEVSPKRPWISQKTLDLISKNSVARREGNYSVENQLAREVRASAKVDRKILGSGASGRELEKYPTTQERSR